MIEQLRQTLRALEKPAGIEDGAGTLPLGVPAIDAALGGGLACGALHEIAAAGEAHIAAAAGFVVAVSSLRSSGRATNSSSPLPWGEVGARSAPGEGLRSIESHDPPHPNPLPAGERVSRRIRGGVGVPRNTVWLAEDMALAESGAPYGPGLEIFGLRPERLLTVAAAHRRDLLWAMEEALRCRAVSAVIGELRGHEIDGVAVRRLSLAAAESGALALLLRASPPSDASTAATRWIVSAAPSSPSPGGGGSPSSEAARRGGVTYERSSPPPVRLRHSASKTRVNALMATADDLPPPGGGEKSPSFAVELTRNRRGPLGAWTLQWSDDDERFVLAASAQPVAAPAADRPHRAVA
jgi:protein ImuA